MDHTNAVYQCVSPRIKFPPKPFPFCRAFGALHHGRHSASFPPLSLPLSVGLWTVTAAVTTDVVLPVCRWGERLLGTGE